MSSEELQQKATEHIITHEKQKELYDMKIQSARHKQAAAFQEKLNARLQKRGEAKTVACDVTDSSEETAQVEVPSGDAALAFMTIKNIASILELTAEEMALKTLEDIHDLILKDLRLHNIYMVKEDVGKFLFASQNAVDMINYAMKLQIGFNEKTWPDVVLELPTSRRLFRPEDATKQSPKPLFSGPRVSIGIHVGEATTTVGSPGRPCFSGINILKTETIGNFAQGGQILISSLAWDNIDSSKLSAHQSTLLGVFKLEGFSSSSKLFEILPHELKERAKFFGSVCARCNEVILPKEKFFKAMDCVWHFDHFRCAQCDVNLEGSYMEQENAPYCRDCFILKNAPKCKNCDQSITAGYVNALDAYWHSECFCCRNCSIKPSAEVKVYGLNGYPYCADCYEHVQGN